MHPEDHLGYLVQQEAQRGWVASIAYWLLAIGYWLLPIVCCLLSKIASTKIASTKIASTKIAFRRCSSHVSPSARPWVRHLGSCSACPLAAWGNGEK